ncbi:MAG: hypothetical protein CVU06_14275, partial [Bacteroidetes bacterium HGW-Bacteroidetes-22]
VDDFVREIEVGSQQTFLNFLYALYDCTTLERSGEVSFYISNIRWLKLKEIGLNERPAQKRYFEDDEELRADERRRKLPFILMTDAFLSDYIEDPHQRLILEHPGGEVRLFYIELLKISKSADGVIYPRCVVRKGELPVKVQYIAPVMPMKPIEKKVTNLLEELARVQVPLISDDEEEPVEEDLDDEDDASGLADEADEDIDEEIIGKDIEDMLEDDTFSKILAGETPEPKVRKSGGGRKPRTHRDDDDDMLGNIDDEEESYGKETYGNDDEDFGNGFEISGGNNDDDYY